MSLMDEKVSKSGNVSRDGRSRITTSTQPESISSDELFRKATKDEGEDKKEGAVEEEEEEGEGEGEKGGVGRGDGDDRDHDHDHKSSRSKKGRKKGSSSHGESGKDNEKHQDGDDTEGLRKEEEQDEEDGKEEKPIVIYKKRAAKKNAESRGDDTSQENFNKPMTLVAISSDERSHASSISSSSTIEEDWDSDEEDEDGGKSKHKEVKDKILGGAKSFATRGKSALGGLKELKGTSRKWQSALFM